jgi:hypothetical protein
VTCDQNKGKGNGKLLNKDEKEQTGGWKIIYLALNAVHNEGSSCLL